VGLEALGCGLKSCFNLSTTTASVLSALVFSCHIILVHFTLSILLVPFFVFLLSFSTPIRFPVVQYSAFTRRSLDYLFRPSNTNTVEAKHSTSPNSKPPNSQTLCR